MIWLLSLTFLVLALKKCILSRGSGSMVIMFSFESPSMALSTTLEQEIEIRMNNQRLKLQ